MVISSEGRTPQHQGGLLGQYEYDEDKAYYVQKSTEQNDEKFHPYYLYRRPSDEEWVVGSTPFATTGGWLLNPHGSKTLPTNTSGWQYLDHSLWHEDPSLTVTPGTLPSLPRQFTVTATGVAAEKYPSYLGVYTKTKRWWCVDIIPKMRRSNSQRHTCSHWAEP